VAVCPCFQGTRIKVKNSSKIPRNWTDFLRDPENKRELFSFLAKGFPLNLPSSKNVFITFKTTTIRVGHENSGLDECDHEEADTRIILHVCHVLRNGSQTVLVESSDSDVVVLLIGHFSQFRSISKEFNLQLLYGQGNKKRYLDINCYDEALGPLLSRALPVFTALTECDTTSSLRFKSKRQCFRIWKSVPEEIFEIFLEIARSPFEALDERQFALVEKFFVSLYGGSVEKSINQVRRQNFSHNQNVERLPPTREALRQHVARAIYQSGIWTSAGKPKIQPPDPQEFGWINCGGALFPKWTKNKDVPEALTCLTKCACQKTCSKACSCMKNDLSCTELCKCKCDK